MIALVAAAFALEIHDGERLRVDAGGDLKTFMVASFPYEHLFLASPDCPNLLEWEDCIAPSGQGIADQRLKLEFRTERLAFKAHHSTTMLAPGTGASLLGTTGVGQRPAELVELSWTAWDESGLALRGRADWLSLSFRVPHLDLTLGRQPITFGRAFFFTPLDLVNPFNPTVIDQEYKPGVDALRIDGYWGMAGHATLVAAWTASPLIAFSDDTPTEDEVDLDDVVLSAYGQGTVGVWDLGLFAGLVHRDRVLGLASYGSVRAVGLRGELTYTRPDDEDEDPFLRAVVGADWLPVSKVMLSSEVYVQTNGASSPSHYLGRYEEPRWTRGELWLAGRSYGALSASYELHPLVSTSLTVIANLEDPSALLAPGLSWSVSDEVGVSLTGFTGLGERPDDVDPLDLLDPDYDAGSSLNSEFGTMPAALFLSMRAYQ